ncbi:exodeoxyribonuclease I [Buchnera aphidicola (Formosaphis micheliae)]|uniref:exodeoxyribonuclease I n=1 Tax=Buchnera aphidicola TaxID=9 RepID=UPI0031CCCB33
MSNRKKNTFTFLFYDYETFGTHPALDKPNQFSCIRTDIDFNIIETSKTLFCYPPLDYLPNPESILVTGITPQYTYLNGLNEFYFARNIYNILSVRNTCIIGYNNINFDDEITRNIFYRNFIDPYDWSWRNGNSRWDVLSILRAYYALRPYGINWLSNSDGFPSFKLEDMSKANNISHRLSHNALSDVYATIELVKLLKFKQPKLFNFLLKNKNKQMVLNIINNKILSPIFYITGFFGTKRNNISLITPFVLHPKNHNIFICFDLNKDITNLIKFVHDSNSIILDFNLFFSVGILFIHVNKCPILAPLNCLSNYEMDRLGINYSYCIKNLNVLRKQQHVLYKIKLLLDNNVYNSSTTNDIDLRIYESFFCNNDKKNIKLISKKLPLNCNINSISFYDKKINDILFRCKARNFPYFLTHYEKQKWLKHCHQVLHPIKIDNYKVKIKKFLMQNKHNKKNIFLLKSILLYLKELEIYIG